MNRWGSDLFGAQVPEGAVDHLGGVTFWEDGTVEIDGQPRLPVSEVQYLDGRTRKSLAGRVAGALVTGGVSLMVTGPNQGCLAVVIVTPGWTHTVRSRSNLRLVNAVYARAVQAKVRAGLPS